MNGGGWRTIRQKIYSMIIAEIKFGRAVRCTVLLLLIVPLSLIGFSGLVYFCNRRQLL